MKINNSMAILFWLCTQKTDSSSKAPIYCRITIDGKRTQFSTGIKIESAKWSSASSKATGTTQEAKNLNEDLETIKGNLRRIYNQLQATHSQVTGDMVKNAYTGKDQERKTIIDIFTLFNALLYEKVKQQKAAKKTWQRFEGIKKNIISYLKKEYSLQDKPLRELKQSFGEEFFHFLLLHQKLKENTAMHYIKKVKQVLGFAVRKGWLDKNPIIDIKCTYKPPSREILSMAELNTLYATEMPNERLEEVKDVYLFSCYTGYAYKEVRNLAPKNITLGMDGNKWVSIQREKTDAAEMLPLLPLPLELIEKYREHPYCVANNKLFPVRSNQKYNQNLKQVAKVAGINKNLTTHTARHTFATTVTLENDVPLETVSKLLGHRSIRTTQIYAKVTVKKLSNNMQLLKDKLFPKQTETVKTGT